MDPTPGKVEYGSKRYLVIGTRVPFSVKADYLTQSNQSMQWYRIYEYTLTHLDFTT
jgi:hypothetical protein